MTTRIELNEADVRDAVAAHLERQGYKVGEVAVLGSQEIKMTATVEKAEKPARSRKKGGAS